MNAELALHREKLGGVWSAISKKKKPRDYICQLKIPDTIPQKYTCSSKNMANVAMKYHDKIQAYRVDSQTDFTLGWICPIYEKKNPTDISNY